MRRERKNCIEGKRNSDRGKFELVIDRPSKLFMNFELSLCVQLGTIHPIAKPR